MSQKEKSGESLEKIVEAEIKAAYAAVEWIDECIFIDPNDLFPIRDAYETLQKKGVYETLNIITRGTGPRMSIADQAVRAQNAALKNLCEELEPAHQEMSSKVKVIGNEKNSLQ